MPLQHHIQNLLGIALSCRHMGAGAMGFTRAMPCPPASLWEGAQDTQWWVMVPGDIVVLI